MEKIVESQNRGMTQGPDSFHLIESHGWFQVVASDPGIAFLPLTLLDWRYTAWEDNMMRVKEER